MLRDIAAEADLAPAQAHAYLASFRRIELVEQETGSGRYLLGPAAIKLAMARFRGSEVISAANREAKTLSQDLGVMVAIVVSGSACSDRNRSPRSRGAAGNQYPRGNALQCNRIRLRSCFCGFRQRARGGDRAVAELSAATENPTSLSNLKVAFQNAIAQAREQGYSWLENKSRAGHQFCLGARFSAEIWSLPLCWWAPAIECAAGATANPFLAYYRACASQSSAYLRPAASWANEGDARREFGCPRGSID